MDSNHTREIRIINIVVLIIVIVAAVMPSILVHQNIEAVTISPDIFSNGNDTLAHRQRGAGEDPVDTFKATVPFETLSALPKTDLGIVITRMDGQGYRVWWNGRFIGQAGDPYRGRANIWNSSNVFLIEGRMIQEENLLTIQTYSLYEVGTYDHSIQITSWRNALRIERRYDLLSSDITLISIGMAIFAAITIMVHTILNAHNKKKMLAIMLAMLLMSLNGIDYLKLDCLAFSYLLYKKLVTASLFLSIFFLGAAAGSTVKSRIPALFSGILALGYIVGELFIQDIVVFKNFYNYMAILLPANLIVWLFVLGPRIREKSEARIFFLTLFIATAVASWEVVALLYLPDQLVTSPFPQVIILSALLTMFLALSNVERNRQLQDEIAQKDKLFVQAISDAQTGIYNKPYFADRLEKMSPPFTVAMIDIDDFKQLNDHYGHLIGDAGILTVVGAIEEKTGKNDLLGRYGGDEFMAAICCQPKDAKAICEGIRKTIETCVVQLNKKKVNITVSIGLYHVKKKKPTDEIFQKADMALYAAKAAGKNCIKTYKKKKYQEN